MWFGMLRSQPEEMALLAPYYEHADQKRSRRAATGVFPGLAERST